MKLALQICDSADKTRLSPQLLTELLELGLDPASCRGGTADCTHLLKLNAAGLSLQALPGLEKGQAAAAPSRVDFLSADLDYRRRTSGKSQGLAQAVGLNKFAAPCVLDATAGFGRDAFILASLGCQVSMLERSPLMHLLLLDGLQRAAKEGSAEVRQIISRMSLQQQDARERLQQVLQGSSARPDVIYLDPMFPPRSKSAKVKKDIALLQDVIGVDEDYRELLQLARRCAGKRVVLKRPGSERQTDPDVHFRIGGKAACFDVYLPQSM